ncbi:hypothetical protein [Pseudomonas sp. GL-B-26]|uniref:hypothetical protein n=2 Tax=unclassified Pseudomonas TaxID=196821 RepID=UPI001CBB0C47|nr:hypothetical protein [Pseudomonas sp. GL-B-26]
MIDDEIDRELIKFIHNPLQQASYLDSYIAQLSIVSKKLLKHQRLQHLITSEQTKFIIAKLLKIQLEHLRTTIQEHIFEDPLPPDESIQQRYMRVISDYFKIGIALTSRPTEQKQEILEQFTASNTWSKLVYTCNRISENLHLESKHNLSILNHSKLWLAYYLSEVFYFLSRGLMTARFAKGIITISPTPAFEKKLKAHWISETSEYSSNLSDTITLIEMAKIFKEYGHIPTAIREQLINSMMDKCLSIHANYLSENLKEHPTYFFVRELVYVACHIEIKAILGNRETSKYELLSYVRASTINAMTSALSKNDKTLLNTAKNFIEVRADSFLRGALDFKYGLKKLVGLMTEFNKQPKDNFQGMLGENFEKDYISNYIKKLKQSKFKVLDGFKAENNAQITSYDIDLVLLDQKHNNYYFIQIKYRLTSQPTYLSEQCLLMQDKEFNKGYIKQLLTLKENLDTDSIRKKLARHNLADARTDNSFFILLHNLPFLNFFETKGIYFYEWNLFRNILKNGEFAIKKNDSFQTAHALTDPQLHRIENIADEYLSNMTTNTSLEENFEIYRNAHAVFEFSDLKFICKHV